jgi:hypothetical protein
VLHSWVCIRNTYGSSYLYQSIIIVTGVFTSNFTFVPFLTILTYGLMGNNVTPDKAFFAVAIFNVMTEVMMYYVPNAAASIGELRTSVRRIQVFRQPNVIMKSIFSFVLCIS